MKKLGPMTKVRDEIKKLQREVEHWKKLAEPAIQKDASNVMLVDALDGPRNLPPNAKIGFVMAGDKIQIAHDVRRGEYVLNVYWAGVGQLAVLPSAGNVLSLTIIKDT